MPKTIRGISIRQPFAELIFQGKKKVEYRSRPTNIRECVYIYASLKPNLHSPSWKQAGYEIGELSTGVILGTVEIADCVWSPRDECYTYRLKNPKRFRKSVKFKGHPQPGFWRPKIISR